MMTAVEKIKSLESKMFADDVIAWNKLCSDGAPDNICNEFADKMVAKYPLSIILKRFRVLNDSRNVVEKYDTLSAVYSYFVGLTNGPSKSIMNGIEDLEVECVEDDIVISATEVFNSFEEGECPEDLQFF